MHLAELSHTCPGPLGSISEVSGLEEDEKKFDPGNKRKPGQKEIMVIQEKNTGLKLEMQR